MHSSVMEPVKVTKNSRHMMLTRRGNVYQLAGQISEQVSHQHELVGTGQSMLRIKQEGFCEGGLFRVVREWLLKAPV